MILQLCICTLVIDVVNVPCQHIVTHITKISHSSWGNFMHVLSVIGEQAKRARRYQGCTNSRWCGIIIYQRVR